MEIEIINPCIFDECRTVRAFFTLRNKHICNDNPHIKGLNLGFNTHEAPEIVEKNRHDLLAAFSIDPDAIAFANQEHGNRVKVVHSGGTFAGTDGLITQVRRLALAIQIADCAAVLIADPESKTIAAVHAGWRGAVADILPRTLKKMSEIGAGMRHCRAFISPCISLANFEVGPEVAGQFPDQFVDYENYEKPHINLKAFLAHQLQQVGVPSKRIEIHPGCTLADESFYSYRREEGQSGRMMAVIELREVPA